MERTKHVVRIRDDLWAAFAASKGTEYHNNLQEFVENCLIEKLGFENIEQEIEKSEAEIAKIQALNKQRREFLKNNNQDADERETNRKKVLHNLLKIEFKDWTSMNKAHAIKVGKFKSRDELEEWVRNH